MSKRKHERDATGRAARLARAGLLAMMAWIVGWVLLTWAAHSQAAQPVITPVPEVAIVTLPGARLVCWLPVEAQTPGVWVCASMGEVTSTCRIAPVLRCDYPMPRVPGLYPRAAGDGEPA